jgi:predicted house-cleaning noncanonical NTP pyrophosphatase (MazG superfamily)
MQKWLDYIRLIAEKRDKETVYRKLAEECKEYLQSQKIEEVLDIFNVASIILLQEFKEIPYQTLYQKLVKRSARWEDKV